MVDLVLIALIIMFAVNGYRQGFLVGGLSFCGFFGGALVGLQVAPWFVEAMDTAFARVVVSLALVFGLALLGQAAAAWAGGRLRGAISNQHGRKLDDIGGIVVSVLALLVVAWMVAVPLASSSLPSVSRSVRNSVILHGVDAVMPDPARVLYNRLRDTIAAGDFPNVFGDLTPTRAREVPAPDPALVGSPAVAIARNSVVKVTGTAPSCRRRIEGSGFVYAPQRVMTNAHVVAGTQGALTVEVNGERRSGRVVYYDPDRDLAVLYVPDLAAPPMTWADALAETGADAIVVGYPLDGPFTPVSARIRDVQQRQGSQHLRKRDRHPRGLHPAGHRPQRKLGWATARHQRAAARGDFRRRTRRPRHRFCANPNRGPPRRRRRSRPGRASRHRPLHLASGARCARAGSRRPAAFARARIAARSRSESAVSDPAQARLRYASWMRRVPWRRVTSQPRPGGCGEGRTLPSERTLVLVARHDDAGRTELA